MNIDNVVPARFSPGDTVTILGNAFSPTFGDNYVTIDTVPCVIASESDVAISVDVPLGISVDQFVAVQVQRSDTGDNTARSFWSKGPQADLLTGVLQLPGQAPGTLEALDPNPVLDTPQAQDYERYVTHAEYLIQEIATVKGDVLTSDGVVVTAEPVGAPGQALEAAPAAGNGLAWAAAPAVRLTHSWAKQIDAFLAANGAMVANGETGDQSTVKPEHAAAVAGTCDGLTVLVQNSVGGDTLNQVQLAVNGIVVYDSGGGLGLVAGQSHSANPVVAVVATDRLALRVFKAGVAGVMDLRGKASVA